MKKIWGMDKTSPKNRNRAKRVAARLLAVTDQIIREAETAKRLRRELDRLVASDEKRVAK